MRIVNDEAVTIGLNPCTTVLERAEGSRWVRVTTQGNCADMGVNLSSGGSVTVDVFLNTSDTRLAQPPAAGVYRCVLIGVVREDQAEGHEVASLSFEVGTPSS